MQHKTTRRGNTQTEQAVIQQSTIPELVSESSTQAVMKQQALKPLKRVQGLSGFTTAQGFTLIELLVVVLIIGILAAVALPQYNKAVKKAHGAEVLATFDALDKALTSYYLEHGTYDVTSLDELNLDIPAATHFKFSVGTSLNANKLSSSFSLNALQTGSSGLDNVWGKSVGMASPDKVSVVGFWAKGKLHHIECHRGNKTSCAEYFNCGAEPIVEIPNQVGSTNIFGGDCYLK